jgi:hypothetical protein
MRGLIVLTAWLMIRTSSAMPSASTQEERFPSPDIYRFRDGLLTAGLLPKSGRP